MLNESSRKRLDVGVLGVRLVLIGSSRSLKLYYMYMYAGMIKTLINSLILFFFFLFYLFHVICYSIYIFFNSSFIMDFLAKLDAELKTPLVLFPQAAHVGSLLYRLRAHCSHKICRKPR